LFKRSNLGSTKHKFKTLISREARYEDKVTQWTITIRGRKDTKNKARKNKNFWKGNEDFRITNEELHFYQMKRNLQIALNQIFPAKTILKKHASYIVIVDQFCCLETLRTDAAQKSHCGIGQFVKMI